MDKTKQNKNMFISSSRQTKRAIYWPKLLDHHLEKRVYQALRPQDFYYISLFYLPARVNIESDKKNIFLTIVFSQFVPHSFPPQNEQV